MSDTTYNNDELRDVLTDLRIYMKQIKYTDKEGHYYIGNCNMNVNLKNSVLRFIPPMDGDDSARNSELVITNSTYKNAEFEDHISSEFDLVEYYYGLCNMDITVMHTVFKFFDATNTLIINQVQQRVDGERVSNPMEVKIRMQYKNLDLQDE